MDRKDRVRGACRTTFLIDIYMHTEHNFGGEMGKHTCFFVPTSEGLSYNPDIARIQPGENARPPACRPSSGRAPAHDGGSGSGPDVRSSSGRKRWLVPARLVRGKERDAGRSKDERGCCPSRRQAFRRQKPDALCLHALAGRAAGGGGGGERHNPTKIKRA